MNNEPVKKGDKVQILRMDIFHLRHRKLPWRGTVTHRDGGYIMVKPNWCRWVIELYDTEVRKI